MQLRTYSVADLETVLDDPALENSDVLPITKHRALSQANNPRAEGSDLALVVALKDEQVVGYQGVLPGRIRHGSGWQRVGWLSTWWVDPQAAVPALAVRLFMKAVRRYQGRVLAMWYTPAAGKVYDASKRFDRLAQLTGRTFRIRKRHAWRGTSNRHNRLKWVVKEAVVPLYDAYRVAERWGGITWVNAQEARFDGAVLQTLSHIDRRTDEFIRIHNLKDLTGRSGTYLNWVIQYPWVVQSPLTERQEHRYTFSATADSVSTHPINVYLHGEQVGFMLVSVRDGKVQLPYVHYKNGAEGVMAFAVGAYAVMDGAQRMTLFDEGIIKALLANDFPAQSTKQVTRNVLVSKTLSSSPYRSYRIHSGDGDCVFG